MRSPETALRGIPLPIIKKSETVEPLLKGRSGAARFWDHEFALTFGKKRFVLLRIEF